MTRASVLFALCALLPASSILAQDTTRIDPVIVTATRTPIGLGALPVAVTVMSGDALRSRGITTVAGALAEVASAYVAQTGSPGSTTSLFLRGGESKYVKVLVDGVPTNDPGGAYDFASLTTDNVERIEIVRGPASVIHGADAVAGVVHVITRRGAGQPRVELDLRTGATPRDRIASAREPGSMRTLDGTATTMGAIPSGSYSVALARHESTGLYDVNNDFLNNVLSTRVTLSPVSGTDVRLALRYTDYRFHYPTNGGGTVTDTNAFREEDRTVIGVELERAIRSTVRAVLSLRSSANDGGTNDAMDSPSGSSFVSQDRTRRRGAELRVHALAGSAAALTIGAQAEQQDQRSQLQSESSFGPFTSRFSAARRGLGAYVEAVLTPSDRWTATVGARADDNQQFGTFGTGRAGISWRPLPATRFRATAGNAFREPSFFENFSTGFVTGNPALRPERTVSVDAGIEQALFAGRANVVVTGFTQRFRDMIDYTGSTASCGFSYCNVAEATSNGVELEVDAAMGRGWRASAAATLLRTKVVEPGFDASSAGLYRRGERLIRRPEEKYSAELSHAGASPLSLSVRVLAVGRRADRDFTGFPASPVTLPAYQRVDIAGEYRLRAQESSRSSVTFRVENVANARYQNVFNFLAPRRTISLGLRMERQ